MVNIRPAAAPDMARISEIYAHYVLHGLASFETEPPDEQEMTARWKTITGRGLPYIVAEDGGGILGYAYAGPYRTRRAYRFSVENSVYLDPAETGRGLGRTLLEQIIAACTQAGCRQMIAIIGDSGNAASIGLHRSLGFEETGTLRGVGFKAGRWVDTVIMQRVLGDGEGSPPEDGGPTLP